MAPFLGFWPIILIFEQFVANHLQKWKKDRILGFWWIFGPICSSIFILRDTPFFLAIFRETNRILLFIFPEKQAASGTRARASLGRLLWLSSSYEGSALARPEYEELSQSNRPSEARARGYEQILSGDLRRQEQIGGRFVSKTDESFLFQPDYRDMNRGVRGGQSPHQNNMSKKKKKEAPRRMRGPRRADVPRWPRHEAGGFGGVPLKWQFEKKKNKN